MGIIKEHGKHNQDPELNHFHREKANLDKFIPIGTIYEHKDDNLKALHTSSDLEAYIRKNSDLIDDQKSHQQYINDPNKPKSHHSAFLQHLSDNITKLKTYRSKDKNEHELPFMIVYEENNTNSNKYVKNNFLQAKVYRLNDEDLHKNYSNNTEMHKFMEKIDKSYNFKSAKEKYESNLNANKDKKHPNNNYKPNTPKKDFKPQYSPPGKQNNYNSPKPETYKPQTTYNDKK